MAYTVCPQVLWCVEEREKVLGTAFVDPATPVGSNKGNTIRGFGVRL